MILVDGVELGEEEKWFILFLKGCLLSQILVFPSELNPINSSSGSTGPNLS